METNRRIRIGNLFLPSAYATVMDHLTARMVDRKGFQEGERNRLSIELRDQLLAALKEVLGPGVRHLRLTFSRKAGCRMCPCSPGFSVSGVVDTRAPYSDLLIPALRGYPSDELAVFYVHENRTMTCRTHDRRYASRGRGYDYVQRDICTVVLPGYAGGYERVQPAAG